METLYTIANLLIILFCLLNFPYFYQLFQASVKPNLLQLTCMFIKYL